MSANVWLLPFSKSWKDREKFHCIINRPLKLFLTKLNLHGITYSETKMWYCHSIFAVKSHRNALLLSALGLAFVWSPAENHNIWRTWYKWSNAKWAGFFQLKGEKAAGDMVLVSWFLSISYREDGWMYSLHRVHSDRRRGDGCKLL